MFDEVAVSPMLSKKTTLKDWPALIPDGVWNTKLARDTPAREIDSKRARTVRIMVRNMETTPLG
jgi:hypothetical protein